MSNNAETDIKESIKNLRATKLKLLSIDKDKLDQKGKNKLADNLNACSVNISKLENTDLKKLDENFKSKVPKLKCATETMKKDLDSLTNALEIIKVASAGLNIVTEITNPLV